MRFVQQQGLAEAVVITMSDAGGGSVDGLGWRGWVLGAIAAQLGRVWWVGRPVVGSPGSRRCRHY